MVSKEYKMRNAQQQVESSFAELESITSQLIEEFTAFKRQRSLDMKNILINFVKMQVLPYYKNGLSYIMDLGFYH